MQTLKDYCIAGKKRNCNKNGFAVIERELAMNTNTHPTNAADFF